jgi:hypothetical protein
LRNFLRFIKPTPNTARYLSDTNSSVGHTGVLDLPCSAFRADRLRQKWFFFRAKPAAGRLPARSLTARHTVRRASTSDWQRLAILEIACGGWLSEAAIQRPWISVGAKKDYLVRSLVHSNEG